MDALLNDRTWPEASCDRRRHRWLRDPFHRGVMDLCPVLAFKPPSNYTNHMRRSLCLTPLLGPTWLVNEQVNGDPKRREHSLSLSHFFLGADGDLDDGATRLRNATEGPSHRRDGPYMGRETKEEKQKVTDHLLHSSFPVRKENKGRRQPRHEANGKNEDAPHSLIWWTFDLSVIPVVRSSSISIIGVCVCVCYFLFNGLWNRVLEWFVSWDVGGIFEWGSGTHCNFRCSLKVRPPYWMG